jgi:CDP-glycerol glycerophosphotransferase
MIRLLQWKGEVFSLSIKNTVQGIKYELAKVIIFIFHCIPIKRNKILFFSYYGGQYGCNPKYISEYLLRSFPEGQFDLVWAFDDLSNQQELTGVKKVKTMSLKYFYELCTSKVIITNYRTINLFRKRKGQFYIQTWHSSLRLKQIEKDVEAALTPEYIRMAQEDSQKINLLLSGCKFSTDIFKRAFWYNGEILECGTPRNDLFFQNNSQLRKNILKKLNIPEDKKVVLYAPTFRNNNDIEVYNLDFINILEVLTKRFGGEWVFLVRLHPHWLSQSKKIEGKFSGVIDVTKYDDIQELLSISDCIISDYSSLIFDFSITKRPCFLYVPDLNQYVNQERELYFEIAELPFITSESNNELIEKIADFNQLEYNNELASFFNKIGSFEDGNACESVAERIKEICFQYRKGNITNEAI